MAEIGFDAVCFLWFIWPMIYMAVLKNYEILLFLWFIWPVFCRVSGIFFGEIYWFYGLYARFLPRHCHVPMIQNRADDSFDHKRRGKMRIRSWKKSRFFLQKLWFIWPFFFLIPSGMFFMIYMADDLYGRKKPILGQFWETMIYMAGHINHYPL